MPAPFRGRDGTSHILTIWRTEGVHLPLRPQNPFLLWEVKFEFWPARKDTVLATSRKASEQEHSMSPAVRTEPRKLTRFPACSAAPSPVKPTSRNSPRLPACPWGSLRDGGQWPTHPWRWVGEDPSYRESLPVQIQDSERQRGGTQELIKTGETHESQGKKNPTSSLTLAWGLNWTL